MTNEKRQDTEDDQRVWLKFERYFPSSRELFKFWRQVYIGEKVAIDNNYSRDFKKRNADVGLNAAILSKNYELIARFVNTYGANVDANAIEAAFDVGNATLIEAVKKYAPPEIAKRYSSIDVCMQLAARFDHVHLMHQYIRECNQKMLISAIEYAVLCASFHVFDFLLSANSCARYQMLNHNKLLILACQSRNYDMIKHVIAMAAENGETELDWNAALKACAETLHAREIISRGATDIYGACRAACAMQNLHMIHFYLPLINNSEKADLFERTCKNAERFPRTFINLLLQILKPFAEDICEAKRRYPRLASILNSC